MKTLKFTPELCEQILSGEKTSTWRLFDDKNLQVGDELDFVNKETGESIGVAKIMNLKVTSLGELTEEDWIGHERYNSEEEMYKAYRKYYGDKVTPETELKIIHFKLKTR
jgi:hypothetical protein